MASARRASGRAAALGALGLAASAFGCASTQEVRIACVPESVRVYVDGRLLEDSSEAVVLRRDLPHKIYAKGPGYQPRLVVLEPTVGPDGELQLASGDVCIDPVPVGTRRELELDVEEEAPAETPASRP